MRRSLAPPGGFEAIPDTFPRLYALFRITTARNPQGP